MVCAPVFLVGCVLLARPPTERTGPVIAPLALIRIRPVGVAHVPTAYVLLSLIGAIAVPTILSRGEPTLLLAAAAVQLAVGWTVADITTAGERGRHAIRRWLHVETSRQGRRPADHPPRGRCAPSAAGPGHAAL
jgi:hypothetical protein